MHMYPVINIMSKGRCSTSSGGQKAITPKWLLLCQRCPQTAQSINTSTTDTMRCQLARHCINCTNTINIMFLTLSVSLY